MVQLEEAIKILCGGARRITDTEKVGLEQASGRILAEDVTAGQNQPPFPRSPLDGYAVRGADTLSATKEKPVRLKVVGKIYAGDVFSGEIREGECVRIMTGAPIPPGADTVVRQEDTDYGQDEVQIYKGSDPYRNYCPAGEDYRKGDVLLKKGSRLNGMRVGVAAGSGRDKLSVYRQPRITVISTGDEVTVPGQELKPGKIFDSNRYLVAGRLKDLGIPGISTDHCEDNVSEMCRRIREAARVSDLIITIGGVSVGEKDIMHQVQKDLGAKKLFWKVGLKPGAPTLAFMLPGEADVSIVEADGTIGEADIGREILVICLTGNPYGVAVNFELLVRPVLAALTGDDHFMSRRIRCVLENESPKRGGLRRFMRGYLEDDGHSVQILTGSHASGTLSSISSCNCLLEIPEGGSGRAGDEVWTYVL